MAFFTRSERDPAHVIWRDFEWGDRTLIGFLIGVIALFFISSGVAALSNFMAQRVELSSQVQDAAVWILTMILLTAILGLLRLTSGVHLYSPVFRERAARFVWSRLGVWLVLLAPVFLFLYVWICTLSSRVFYQLTGNYVAGLLSGFLSTLVGFYIVSYLGTIILVLAISGTATRMAATVSAYLANFKWSLKSLRKSIIRNRWVCVAVVLIIFLGFLVPWSDSRIGYFVPKVQYVQTHYPDNGLTVTGSVRDYAVLITVDEDYLIAPSLSGFVRNLTVANPSNYSVNCCGTTSVTAVAIGSNVNVVPLSESNGRLIAFSLTWDQTSSPFLLKTTYENVLTGSRFGGLVNYDFPDPISLGNGTLRQTIHITLNNKFDKPLNFQMLLIRTVPLKIVNYTCTLDGHPRDGICLPMWNNLYIQNLSPPDNGSMSVTVVLDYY